MMNGEYIGNDFFVQYIIKSYYDEWGIHRKRFEVYDHEKEQKKLLKKAYDKQYYIYKKKEWKAQKKLNKFIDTL